MLNFKRRAGESFYIYPNKGLPPGMTVEELFNEDLIEVVIVDQSSNQTKVGVKAPKGLVIVRGELVRAERLAGDDGS